MMKVFAAAMLLAVGCHATTIVGCGSYKIKDHNTHDFACFVPSAATVAYATIKVTTPGFLCKGARLSVAVAGANEGELYVKNGQTGTVDLSGVVLRQPQAIISITNKEKTCDASTTVTLYFNGAVASKRDTNPLRGASVTRWSTAPPTPEPKPQARAPLPQDGEDVDAPFDVVLTLPEEFLALPILGAVALLLCVALLAYVFFLRRQQQAMQPLPGTEVVKCDMYSPLASPPVV